MWRAASARRAPRAISGASGSSTSHGAPACRWRPCPGRLRGMPNVSRATRDRVLAGRRRARVRRVPAGLRPRDGPDALRRRRPAVRRPLVLRRGRPRHRGGAAASTATTSCCTSWPTTGRRCGVLRLAAGAPPGRRAARSSHCDAGRRRGRRSCDGLGLPLACVGRTRSAGVHGELVDDVAAARARRQAPARSSATAGIAVHRRRPDGPERRQRPPACAPRATGRRWRRRGSTVRADWERDGRLHRRRRRSWR